EQRKAIESVENEINPLKERYDELKKQTSLNREEQEELRSVINQIASLLPAAATEWDKYGNAIDINRVKVEQMTFAQRNLLQLRNEETITELQTAFKEYSGLADIYTKAANDITQKIENAPDGGILKILGFDKKGAWQEDLKYVNKQTQLAMGEAYDAARELQRFGIGLSKPQKDVVAHFDGDKARESAKAVFTFAHKAQEALAGRRKQTEKDIKNLNQIINNENTGKEALQEAELWKSKLEERLAAVKKLDKLPTKPDQKNAEREAAQQKRREEQANEHFARLLKEEELFSAQQLIDQKEKNDREVAQLELDFQKKIDKFEEFKTKDGASKKDKAAADDQIAKLELDRDAAVAALKLKQEQDLVDKIAKVRQDLSNKMENE